MNQDVAAQDTALENLIPSPSAAALHNVWFQAECRCRLMLRTVAYQIGKHGEASLEQPA